MNYQDFKNQWVGKRLDYDNVAGYQCVDIIKQWLDSGFSIKPGAWGNAIDYWRNTNPAILSKFKKVTNSPSYVPPQGSIVIFNPTSGNPYGHIAVVDSATLTVLNILEQNGGAGTGTGTGVDAIRVRNSGYNNIAGFLEPINNGGTVDTQIIQNADNWFNRCNKTIMFTRARQMSREEFAPQVGRKFINFVEDAEDSPEADATLRIIEIGKANKIQDTTYWYQVTDKLMLSARGRKWRDNPEFQRQVNRSFIDTANDIFSGPEYEAHQKRIINALSTNTTLQTQVTTLQNELNQCRSIAGSGSIPQATIDTINETNGIVKAIKVVVDWIKELLTSVFRGQ